MALIEILVISGFPLRNGAYAILSCNRATDLIERLCELHTRKRYWNEDY